MHKNEYEFDVLFTNGQNVKVEIASMSTHDAFRQLYTMVNPFMVSEARITMTTETL